MKVTYLLFFDNLEPMVELLKVNALNGPWPSL